MLAVQHPGAWALGWTIAVWEAGCRAGPLPVHLLSVHWAGGWCRRQRLIFSGAVMKMLGQLCPFSLREEPSVLLSPSLAHTRSSHSWGLQLGGADTSLLDVFCPKGPGLASGSATSHPWRAASCGDRNQLWVFPPRTREPSQKPRINV